MSNPNYKVYPEPDDDDTSEHLPCADCGGGRPPTLFEQTVLALLVLTVLAFGLGLVYLVWEGANWLRRN